MQITVQPLGRGEGIQFVDKVVGGAIPGSFIPGIEKAVRQIMDEGAIAGFKMQDIEVEVYDGKHHAVDSKEIAFVNAGRKAFMAAVKEAGPIILEPVVDVLIAIPSQAIQVRSLRVGMPAETTDPVVEIVDRDEHDVRPQGGIGRRRVNSEAGDERGDEYRETHARH